MKFFLLFVVDFLIFTALSMYYHKKHHRTGITREEEGAGVFLQWIPALYHPQKFSNFCGARIRYDGVNNKE